MELLIGVTTCMLLAYCGETPSSQINGLEYIYNSTNGDEWTWSTSSSGIPWNFTGDPNPCMDDWQGVTCTVNCSLFATCDILNIALAEHSLEGTLPPEMHLLSSLEMMNFYRNKLIGI